MWHATLQVIQFELRRTLTVTRVAIWLCLALFPSFLVGLLRIQSRGQVPDEALSFITYMLVPQISCMLGLLLWATPAIGIELESQSWIYLTLRSKGRIALALGKYAVAFLWTASYGLLSALLISVISGVDEIGSLMGALMILVLLSSASYAALYLLIGAAFFRRATVVAVVYSLVLEGAVSWIPATINQATISYRLRTLLSDWTDFGILRTELDEEAEFMRASLGDQPAWFNICCILVYAAVLLTFAVILVHKREFPVQSDT